MQVNLQWQCPGSRARRWEEREDRKLGSGGLSCTRNVLCQAGLLRSIASYTLFLEEKWDKVSRRPTKQCCIGDTGCLKGVWELQTLRGGKPNATNWNMNSFKAWPQPWTGLTKFAPRQGDRVGFLLSFVRTSKKDVDWPGSQQCWICSQKIWCVYDLLRVEPCQWLLHLMLAIQLRLFFCFFFLFSF